MAMLWADSFDHYGTTPNDGRDAMLAGAWGTVGSQLRVSATRARTGTMSLEMRAHSTNGECRRVVSGSGARIGMGFGIWLPNYPAANDVMFFGFRTGSAAIATVTINTDGSLSLHLLGQTGTTVATSAAGVVRTESWDHIECNMLRDSAVGTFEIKVNGTTVLSATNQNFGATNASLVMFNHAGSTSLLAYFIDDLVAWDGSGSNNNTFIGAARVATVFPAATTAENDWVASAGTAVQCIDEVPPNGDTDYITGSTIGDMSEYTIGTLPADTDQIAAVYIPFYGKLVSAGVGNAKVDMNSSASIAVGVDYPLTTSYTYWGAVFPVNPNGSVAWVKATLQAALVRLTKTA